MKKLCLRRERQCFDHFFLARLNFICQSRNYRTEFGWVFLSLEPDLKPVVQSLLFIPEANLSLKQKQKDAKV